MAIEITASVGPFPDKRPSVPEQELFKPFHELLEVSRAVERLSFVDRRRSDHELSRRLCGHRKPVVVSHERPHGPAWAEALMFRALPRATTCLAKQKGRWRRQERNAGSTLTALRARGEVVRHEHTKRARGGLVQCNFGSSTFAPARVGTVSWGFADLRRRRGFTVPRWGPSARCLVWPECWETIHTREACGVSWHRRYRGDQPCGQNPMTRSSSSDRRGERTTS